MASSFDAKVFSSLSMLTHILRYVALMLPSSPMYSLPNNFFRPYCEGKFLYSSFDRTAAVSSHPLKKALPLNKSAKSSQTGFMYRTQRAAFSTSSASIKQKLLTLSAVSKSIEMDHPTTALFTMIRPSTTTYSEVHTHPTRSVEQCTSPMCEFPFERTARHLGPFDTQPLTKLDVAHEPSAPVDLKQWSFTHKSEYLGELHPDGKL